MAKKDLVAMQKRSHELGYRIGRMEKQLHYTEANLKDFQKRQAAAKAAGHDKDAADLQSHIDHYKKEIKLTKQQIAKDKKEEKKIMDQIRKMTR